MNNNSSEISVMEAEAILFFMILVALFIPIIYQLFNMGVNG
jgi:hypothetical protein